MQLFYLHRKCLNSTQISGNLTLNTLSSLTEKLIASQLARYLKVSDLTTKLQLGFRKGHSTDTVLLSVMLNVFTPLILVMSHRLALLDVTTAFDMTYSDILIRCLSICYRITGWPLKWICSFLDWQTIMLTIGLECMTSRSVPFSLPRGSVLGPLLHILHMANLTFDSSQIRKRMSNSMPMMFYSILHAIRPTHLQQPANKLSTNHKQTNQ